MEQLLKKRSVMLTGCALDKLEECTISGEYTLPEYCPDIAVVLKCFASPHIVNRQWSGEQLLLDGSAVIRVLYLDEGRRTLCSLEFTQAFSCTLHGEGKTDNAAVALDISTKYLNCRALHSRRVEVRGALTVVARADCAVHKDIAVAMEDSALYTRTETHNVTIPCSATDKVMTISETLEFPETLPAAEMLLGGDCRAVVRECKLLSGKAIVKGQVIFHQIYCDNTDSEMIHSLDYAVPFSQILDVEDAVEGLSHKASVQVLSDTERCVVGPDGENTLLEVSAKLLIQVQVYRCGDVTIIKDAYHGGYPVSAQTEEMQMRCLLGTRWEETVLPMQLTIPSGRWQEILDVSVIPQEHAVVSNDGRAESKGRMAVCVVARDLDGEIVYDELIEEYTLSYPCRGNVPEIRSVPTALKYRVVDNTLELQVTLCVTVSDEQCEAVSVISDLRLQQDTPYTKPKVTALLYYADAGESIWDIGRHCHTSPACIYEENDLMEECLPEPAVLVVPILN